jgi:hypothetical protein
MNPPEPRGTRLEERLRQLYRGLDTSRDFVPRLAARLASMRAVPDPATRARLRADAELRRRAIEAALKQRLRWTLVAVACLAAGGIAVVERFGEGVARLLAAHVGHDGPAAIAVASCVGFGAAVWYLAQRSLHGTASRADVS